MTSTADTAHRLARGPHACPWCSAATFTEPPADWRPGGRFVARCGSCSRPVGVHVDALVADRVVDLVPPVRSARENVDRWLDAPGRVAAARRVAAALTVALTVGALLFMSGVTPPVLLASVPFVLMVGALWGPGLIALAAFRVSRPEKRLRVVIAPVAVTPARWDELLQEERRPVWSVAA